MEEGIYEILLNNELLDNIDESKFFVGKSKLRPNNARKLLLNYLSDVTERALDTINENDIDVDFEERIKKEIYVCNEVIDLLRSKLSFDEYKELDISENAEILEYAYNKINNSFFDKKSIIRPITSLVEPTLFTNNSKEISLLSELKKEICSCDEVMLVVSFIKYSGLIQILDSLKELTSKGKKLRIITTTYMKATDYKAIETLLNLPNTDVRISYETNNQRLHAKTYIFKRNNGFSTFYIGSSNISSAALQFGDEWNVKLTEKGSPNIFKGVLSEFETYWNSYDYKTIKNTKEDLNRLNDLLEKSKEQSNAYSNLMDFKPFPYQEEILDKIEAERTIYHRNKNLIVAATGVGKTVLAAFDFQKYIENHPGAKLLYVVHRKEILEKSIETFRQILKDYNFGELYVGNKKPSKVDYLFTTVKGANNLSERLDPNYYDYIIVDEIHHAKAETYEKMLKYYTPKILLGLTATPERMDGQDITDYFDHNIAAEMRLPEAINNRLLVPFDYYGITDPTDLSNVRWSNGRYNDEDLNNLFVVNDSTAIKRADAIKNSLLKFVNDMDEVHGLGFCSSVKHAKYMADKFNEYNIPSLCVTGESDDDDRDSAIKKLESGEIKFIFTRDLYNEGIDIPCVNYELLLRPTDSLTIFLQQLGRGLRLNKDKSHLTVLDFVGETNKNFDYTEKMAALIGHPDISTIDSIKNDFPLLPVGCSITLEKIAKEYILSNIKSNMKNRQKILDLLCSFASTNNKNEVGLYEFLKYSNVSVFDIYDKDMAFYRLLKESKIKKFPNDDEFEIEFISKLKRLLYINSPIIIKYIKSIINGNYDKKNLKLKSMIYYALYDKKPNDIGFKSMDELFKKIKKSKILCFELNEICDYLSKSIDVVPLNNSLSFDCPLEVYGIYSQAMIGSAFGLFDEQRIYRIQTGVKFLNELNHYILLVTLNKDEKHFGESIMYKDYPINEYLFNWETQNSTSGESEVTNRYINSNGNISLFVRTNIKENGYTSPYIYLGEVDYVSHHGSKPVSFVWKLKNKIPAEYYIKMKNFD